MADVIRDDIGAKLTRGRPKSSIVGWGRAHVPLIVQNFEFSPMLRISEVFFSENCLLFGIIIGRKRYHVMIRGMTKIIDDLHSLII